MSPRATAIARQKQAVATKAADESVLAMRAYRLRSAGHSLWEIAEDLKITEATASHLIADRLRVAATLIDEGAKRTMIAAELDRLDQLWKAQWVDAVAGDRGAAETCLKISDRRVKLLGLDQQQSGTVTNNTVVIPGTSAEYVAALRQVIQPREN